jgi:hypothetical protein
MALVPFPSKGAKSAPERDSRRLGRRDDAAEASGGKMSFLDHLDELRRRIIWALAWVMIGFAIACVFYQQLFDFVIDPMRAMLPKGQTLIYTEPTEALMLYVKIAIIAGILIASPGVMAQLWLFVAPGLYSHEKKMAVPFIAASSILFISGAAFAHYYVFPSRSSSSAASERRHHVHATHRAGLRPVHEAGAHLRRHLPDADGGGAAGAPGADHGALHVEELQVRVPRHLHHRRRPVARH